MRYRPPGELIDVGSHRLHINRAGAGSPSVVFEAALAGSSISWSLVQPAVSELTLACTYDRAGFAWSNAGPLPRTAGRIASELQILLDRAGVPAPYVLVGHSFGGLVMQILASRCPADVAGLVLVDPAHAEDWVDPAPKEQIKIDRGVRLCRHGATAARFGVARAVGGLVGLGAFAIARAIVRAVSRGGLSREDEGILAPVWKLPPDVRRPLKDFWTEAKFFEALGSQIQSICASAAETLEARANGFGDLRLVTISSTDPGDYRLRQQEALAALSTRGRHVIASNSGHWIPLDQPEVVIEVIGGLLAELTRLGSRDDPKRGE